MFIDLGGTDDLNLNFYQVQEDDEMMQYPIMVAASKGSLDFIKIILKNKGLNLHVKDKTGINAFWVACLFGHGEIMKELAEAGIDVLATNH